MKKQLVILLLIAHVFATTELHQLIKVPFLIQHFFEHKEQNQNLTLTAFLLHHYAEDNAQVPDYDQDMKLPFKSHNDCSSSNLSIFIHQSVDSYLFQPDVSNQILNEYGYHSNIPSQYLSNIWQPPKQI